MELGKLFSVFSRRRRDVRGKTEQTRGDDLRPIRPEELNGLTLAYIGDSAWELLVREYVLSAGESRVADQHAAAVRFTSARAQAGFMRRILPLLDENESSAYRRGRNAKPSHTPKHASGACYREATGFEALIGRLYLDGRTDRIAELFSVILSHDNDTETTI